MTFISEIQQELLRFTMYKIMNELLIIQRSRHLFNTESRLLNYKNEHIYNYFL